MTLCGIIARQLLKAVRRVDALPMPATRRQKIATNDQSATDGLQFHLQASRRCVRVCCALMGGLIGCLINLFDDVL